MEADAKECSRALLIRGSRVKILVLKILKQKKEKKVKKEKKELDLFKERWYINTCPLRKEDKRVKKCKKPSKKEKKVLTERKRDGKVRKLPRKSGNKEP